MLNDEDRSIIARSMPLTKWILITFVLLIVAAFGTGYFFVLAFREHNLVKHLLTLMPLMAALLFIEALLVVLSASLASNGSIIYNKSLAYLGCAIIVGGIWLDVLTTIANTPSLESEGNMFIVVFRELNAPIWTLYILGFLAQLGITIISCSLWIAFLRHKNSYLNSILAMQPRNIIQLFWVIAGGNLKSAKTSPDQKLLSPSYRIVLPAGLFLIDPFARWVLGLEWLGVIPPVVWRVYEDLAYTFLLSASLLVWIIYSYYSQRRALNDGPITGGNLNG